jgi:uncharacterized NAD(P)/FAD-binding protein YdhS
MLDIEHLQVSRIISCKGVTGAPAKSSNPVVESLFAQGPARMDLLDIGMEVEPDCAVVDRRGRPIGARLCHRADEPSRIRADHAVRDISLQAAELARSLVVVPR